MVKLTLPLHDIPAVLSWHATLQCAKQAPPAMHFRSCPKCILPRFQHVAAKLNSSFVTVLQHEKDIVKKELLGGGSFGQVWLGYDKNLGPKSQHFACKLAVAVRLALHVTALHAFCSFSTLQNVRARLTKP